MKYLIMAIRFIQFNFWWFVLRPIRKFVNLCFRGCYVADNDRNRQILDYCHKVVMDPDYEPSTPVEHWVDLEWQKKSKELYEHRIAEGVISGDEPYDYRVARQIIARQVYVTLAEFAAIKAA